MSGSLGLVPTMGSLHEGHLSLVKAARKQNDNVAVSIFVNPIQFGPEEDLDIYPRNHDNDLNILQSEKVDIVWIPDTEEMYPTGYQTYVTVDKLSPHLEGARRPGHMRGVATIVTKLLIAFTPDRLYLGQKDAQQTCIIKRLVADLGFSMDVIICPTVRDADGLALSSRNMHLNSVERNAAVVLYESLCEAKEAFSNGETDAGRLRTIIADMLSLEKGVQPLYVSVADINTLQELQYVSDTALCSIAVKIGTIVLIDNVVLEDS
ncbi:MAG: pantoate--beta-alanine ligase [Anaerolineales bacterium]